MKTLRQFRRLWRLARAIPRVEAEIAWTEDDAHVLRSFLDGQVGRKLTTAMRNVLLSDMFRAMNDGPSRAMAWSAGHAAGMQAMAAHIDLLAQPPAQVPVQATGPTDDLGWMRPQVPT